MEDTALAVRISLASAGAWWLIFTLIFPQRTLRVREAARQLPEGANLFRFGVRRILATFGERETLAGLHIHEPPAYVVSVPPAYAGSHVVH